MDVRDGVAVLALGVAVAIVGFRDGELLHGYGIGPSAFVLHVGVLYVVLGAVVLALGERRPLVTAVGAHVVFFVVACGLMYYDLVVAPPEYGQVPTALDVVANRSALALALLPVTMGYLAGGVDFDAKLRSVLILGGVAVVGPALGSVVLVARGSAPGFTQALFALLGVAAFVAGVPLYFVARRGVPRLTESF